MAKNVGTLVTAPVRPYDDQDTYPVVEDQYFQGGLRVVDTISERNGITLDRRKSGMLVLVRIENKVYQLLPDLVSWTVFEGRFDAGGTEIAKELVIVPAGTTTITFSRDFSTTTTLFTVNGATLDENDYTQPALNQIVLSNPLEGESEVQAVGFFNVSVGTASASNVAVTPTGTLTSNNVQSALQELQTEINNLSAGGGTDDQTAAEVPVTPSGNLSSTNVQDALLELQADIDNGVTSGGLDSYTADLGSGTTLDSFKALRLRGVNGIQTSAIDDGNQITFTIDGAGASGGGGGPITSSSVTYDNTSSGLTSTNIQAATDELDGRIDVLEANNTGVNTGDQLVYKNVATNSGTAVADTTADTLTIVGINGIITTASADTITIDGAGVTGTSYTDEQAQDAVALAMTTNATHNGILVTYDDGLNAINLTNTDKGSTAVTSHEALYNHNLYDAHLVNTNNPHNTTAAQVPYSNTTSGLTAEQVQAAIDELDGRLDAIEVLGTSQLSTEFVSATSGQTVITFVKPFPQGTSQFFINGAALDENDYTYINDNQIQLSNPLEGDSEVWAISFASQSIGTVNAVNVLVTDAGGYYTGDNAEAVFQEIGATTTQNTTDIATLQANNTGTNTGDQIAVQVPYSNATSGLASGEVQGAIDELDARIDVHEINNTGDQVAATVPYDGLASGLAATNVQGAVDELDARLDTLEATPAGVSVSEEGTPVLTEATDLNFVGDNVLVTDDLDGTVTITHTLQTAAQTSYDNVSSGLTATNLQAAVDELATTSGSFTIQDEGITINNNADYVNFVGSAITAINDGLGGVTVTVEGGLEAYFYEEQATNTPTVAAAANVLLTTTPAIDVPDNGEYVVEAYLTIDPSLLVSTTDVFRVGISVNGIVSEYVTYEIDGSSAVLQEVAVTKLLSGIVAGDIISVMVANGSSNAIDVTSGKVKVAKLRGLKGDKGDTGAAGSISEEGVQVIASPTDINFVGPNVTVTDDGDGSATVTITSDSGATAVAAHEATYDHAAYDAHLANMNNPHGTTAALVPYTNTTSGLLATDVQAAIDEIDATLDTLAAGTSTLTVQDEGVVVLDPADYLNFVGGGVSAIDDSLGGVTVLIPEAPSATLVRGELNKTTAQNITLSPNHQNVTFNQVVQADGVTVDTATNSMTIVEDGLYDVSAYINWEDSQNGNTDVLLGIVELGQPEREIRVLITRGTALTAVQYIIRQSVAKSNAGADMYIQADKRVLLQAGDVITVQVRAPAVSAAETSGAVNNANLTVTKLNNYKGDKGDPGGGSIPFKEEGVLVEATPNSINFTGDSVTVVQDGTGGVVVNVEPLVAATDVTYSNATSGLLSTNVQSAIDELDGRTDALESASTTNESRIATLENQQYNVAIVKENVVAAQGQSVINFIQSFGEVSTVYSVNGAFLDVNDYTWNSPTQITLTTPLEGPDNEVQAVGFNIVVS